MARAVGALLAAAMAATFAAGAAIGVEGPAPRSVPTQTIIAPPDSAETQSEAPADAADEEPAPQSNASELPAVEYDAAKLPTPVRRLREQIMEAAATGDPEALRTIFEANGEMQLGAREGEDFVAYLASLSGDPGGREILAILIEVFEAGYVHVDAGTDDEMYLWPYFARYPIEALTPPQQVELFKLVLPGDVEDMQVFGFYNWYRAGIAPDGTWLMFTTD